VNHVATNPTQRTEVMNNHTQILDVCINGSSIMDGICSGYPQDTIFSKILEHLSHHAKFLIHNSLIYFKKHDMLVLCVPRVIVMGHRLTKSIIDHGHTSLSHLGLEKTEYYIACFYQWPTMSRGMLTFCKSCGQCQVAKDSTQKPKGLLHSLPIPTRLWESIGMDFIGPLPITDKGFDFIWTIICPLTGMVYIIPITMSTGAVALADKHLHEVVRLYGVARSIVSNHDP
jgi:Integrase zinc binding domain